MKDYLHQYCLRIGDNSVILSHRLAEYSSYGPFLEEDLAITNVALDLLGQAEGFIKYASEIEAQGKSVDDIVYRRNENEYLNCQLVEYPNEDFAYVCARQFFIDVYNYFLYTELSNSSDDTLAALAAKSLKEVSYHLNRSTDWILRLGNGTEESHKKLQNAVDNLWMYTGELFEMDEVETNLLKEGISADNKIIRKLWLHKVKELFDEAGLHCPEGEYAVTGGRKGVHTEKMGFILTEMQFLPRNYPEAIW